MNTIQKEKKNVKKRDFQKRFHNYYYFFLEKLSN